MTEYRVGVLHPGAMGVSVAASAKKSGHSVYWASEGRSPDTQSRAEKVGLSDLKTVHEICKVVDVILSICPPHAAEEVLEEVIAHEFGGVYVDANAISTHKSLRMAERCVPEQLTYVDGGIVGGPAWEPNSTFLYLCGKKAGQIADLFHDGLLETRVLGDRLGDASALKMCFAAYTKGSTALISMILAASESLGVRKELMRLWAHDGSDFAEKAQARACRVTRKAWRFAGEMDEIADTFEGEGLPDGFHRAARDIYTRISHFQHYENLPLIEEVLSSLLMNPDI